MTQITARVTAPATAKDRIDAVAAEHGWTPKKTAFLETTYRKGTRYVRVYYGVRDQVIEAHRQTGSTGGRSITGTGKAERVIALLTQTRWTNQ
jgi:hypothetical protein